MDANQNSESDNHQSDERLMEAAQNDDRPAFETLVRRYRSALVKVAFSKLGERAWAEDVVQECLLAVYAARHTYKPSFAFRTWLWTILLNLCKNQYQKQKRSPLVLHSTLATGTAHFQSEQYCEPVTEETALSSLLQGELREQVHQLLNSLPEVQADALRLRFFAELKFQDIADTMNCSLNSAKQRVKTGLLKLAEKVNPSD